MPCSVSSTSPRTDKNRRGEGFFKKMAKSLQKNWQKDFYKKFAKRFLEK
jgi:hypothetical protein